MDTKLACNIYLYFAKLAAIKHTHIKHCNVMCKCWPLTSDGALWQLKSATSFQDGVAVTRAEEKLPVDIGATRESALLVQSPAGLPQTLRSGSLQPLKTPSRPSSPRESWMPDTVSCPVSDDGKWSQPPAINLLSYFADQSWFQQYFADRVRIICWCLFS